jgi:hypothetical protein
MNYSEEQKEEILNEAAWNLERLRDFRPRERVVPVPDRRGGA